MRVLTIEEMDSVAGGCGGKGCHANNGWGNGDDNAPGNSLTHNKAENNVAPGARHKVKGTPANPYSNGEHCGNYLPANEDPQ